MSFSNLTIFSLIILCVVVVSTSIKAQDAGNLTIKPYIFKNSKKEKVQAEFGRFKVPENRSKKNGKTIELAFVRFKSTSKNPGSPIVYLAGGPGGSGISSAKRGRFELFMAMRQFGDVIAFDQRGTGQSKPNLRCTESFDLPFDQPMTHESLINQEIKNIRSCAKTWEAKGIDVSAYNTVENANDLNDLRKALGAKKISLWGISYGTHLALATIRQHGKYIDRSILAGVEAMDDTYKLPSNTDKLIEELSQRLKANPKLSRKIPNLIGLINKVHKRLAANPATVEVTDSRTKKKFKVTVGLFDLQFLLANFSGNNRAQSMIPSLYYSMLIGDFSFLAQQVARYRKGRNSNLMSIAMDCASGISKKRSAQIARQKQTAIYANAINMPFPGICSAINYKNLGKKFRKPIKSKVPVLFISGTLDGRTPVSNAESARKGFKTSSHLIIDGAGHSDPLFLSSPKIEDTIRKFMRKENLASVMNIKMSQSFKFQQIRDQTNVSPSTEVTVGRLKNTLPGLMKKADVPGMSVALIRKGKLVWTGGFGVKNADTKEPVTKSTVFEAASLSKPVVAYAVLKLVDKGKIDLDVPLNKYLGNNYDVGDDERLRLITARRVLSHSSGFPNWRRPRNSKTLPINFVPGEKFSYSGEGFVFLSKVVEKITNMNFEDFIQKTVLKPLGMKDSSFVWQDRYENSKTFDHDQFGKVTKRRRVKPHNAAGSLNTTSEEYAKFVVTILEGNGLKQKTHQEMLTSQIKVDEKAAPRLSWGLGIGLQKGKNTSFWHWGDNGNNKSFITASTKTKDAILFFTNGRNGLSFVQEVLQDGIGRNNPAIQWLNYERYDSPSIVLFKEIISKDIQTALRNHQARLKESGKNALSESQMNRLGYNLMSMKKLDDAIRILKKNTNDFPKSANTWDSLAEAQMNKGNLKLAIKYYEKSVSLNPKNNNAIKLIKELKEKLRNSGKSVESKRIDDFVTPFVKAKHFSGVILASKNGKIIYEKAFGLANAAHGIPNKIDTRFGIASVTKHMTKAIAIRLVEEGKLGLKDKLTKYIPDFPDGDKIDVLLLLRHRAAIKHRVTKPHEEAIPYTPADMVEKAKLVPLAYEPDGKKRLYSSAGYSVLARVLEIASGETYSSLLRKYIFKPMGMRDSFDFNGERVIENRASEYLMRSNGFVNAPLKDYSFLVGAGSVFSTAHDVFKFGNAILDGKLGENVKNSLIDGKGLYDDNGNTNGFRCYFKFDRNAGYGFLLIANLESGANNALVKNIPEILRGKSVSPPKIPNPKTNNDFNPNVKEFAGEYSKDFSEFEITLINGSLFAGRLQLSQVGKDRFFAYGTYAEVNFSRDKNGKVVSLSWNDVYGKALWTKKK